MGVIRDRLENKNQNSGQSGLCVQIRANMLGKQMQKTGAT